MLYNDREIKLAPTCSKFSTLRERVDWIPQGSSLADGIGMPCTTETTATNLTTILISCKGIQRFTFEANLAVGIDRKSISVDSQLPSRLQPEFPVWIYFHSFLWVWIWLQSSGGLKLWFSSSLLGAHTLYNGLSFRFNPYICGLPGNNSAVLI